MEHQNKKFWKEKKELLLILEEKEKEIDILRRGGHIEHSNQHNHRGNSLNEKHHYDYNKIYDSFITISIF